MVGLINKEDIYDIADAIREKTQTEDTFKPSEMGDLIRSIRVIPENSYQLKEIESTPTSIATFDADALPMPSLKVSIEPQQDLHGYDHPWVGGSGKNKFDSDTVLSAFTKNNNKYVGTPSSVVDNYVISGGFKTNTQYTLSYKAYNNTSTPSNFRFVFSYTDETEEIIGGFVDTTTEKVIVGTSAENKTISKIKRNYGNGVEITLYDIQLEEGSTATSYAPYSNICPISGHTEANVVVSPTTDAEDGTTYTIQFKDGDNPLTVYGGTLDVLSGLLTITDGYIASYNGETLPSTWISDRDVYAEGSTPTTGAQVVYELATPQTYQLTPTQVKSLLGTNNVWADTGDILEGEYFKAL